MKELVLMVSENKFPNGDAGSLRDLHFAKIYYELGYNVILICKNTECSCGEYETFTYLSTYKKADHIFKKALKYIGYKRQLQQIIKSIECKYGKPKIIHLYSAPVNGVLYLKKYSKKEGLQIIHDSVEWYSACEFSKGIFDKSYILKELLNRKLIDQPIKVIAISKYLENYFSAKGLPTLRIPVLMDKNNSNSDIVRGEEKIHIIYAGSPGNKDSLRDIISAYLNTSILSRCKLCLHVVGVSSQDLIRNKIYTFEEVHLINECVKFYGRIPHSDVLQLLKKMDFSILVRPASERYTKAGFPTKSVEAMMNSVAMMCNLTSDLGMYLKHNENSFIIKDDAVNSIIDAFNDIAKLKDEDILKLRRAARLLAEEIFDYRLYKREIMQLLNK